MFTYTIYALQDPRNNKVRYVGLTASALETRLKEHMQATSGGSDKIRWLHELEQLGVKPKIKILEEDVEAGMAEERETYWINYYHRISPLTNINKLKPNKYSLYFDPELDEKNSEERWMNMRQTARLLGLNYQTLCILVARGEVRSKKSGNWNVRLVEINEIKKVFQKRFYPEPN
ncbi:GIY-YIG nuclease family protein [Dictyobacter arantiisoli]|uniref:GIY-YIG domain-containing protein n=1 Tax=Dictyobacter arantiisoli TaxID=2014874 RepID=A0A5A5TI69_9CHLR|nr:GIY-YIG nuclease family protein [Dictyobacter arantiisoli]GCF10888.1 hypothetical protein KDI_44520 [Dictyobacter arantiisoli]